jgi:hypothetical protein
MGSYEGAIKVIDNTNSRIVTIPVLVNLASKTLNFTFGGNLPSQDLYDNGRMLGGYNTFTSSRTGKLTDAHTGDWRFYYLDIPDQGMFQYPLGMKLITELNWTQNNSDVDIYVQNNSDVDIYVLGKRGADKPTKDSSGRYGPYPLGTVGKSVEWDVPRFNTTTNESQEVVAVDLKSGLNIIALHNVLLNASSNGYDEIIGRGGWIRHTPDITHISKIGYGQAEASFISNIAYPDGITVSAVGPAITEEELDVEIKQDYEKWWNFPNWGEWMMRGNISRIIQVENVLIMDIHIIGKDDAPDLDLAVFRDENKDGELTLDEVEATKNIDAGGDAWATDADGDADENVIWNSPPDGQYIIKVLGFTIVGAKGHFDLEIGLTLDTGEGYKMLESDPDTKILVGTETGLPPHTLELFNISWNFPGDTKPGEYKGAIRIGTAKAKGIISIPVTIVWDYVYFIPEGSILQPDGNFLLPDGTIFKANLPPGSVLTPDGDVELPDGTIIRRSQIGIPWIRDFTIFTTPVGVYRIYYEDKITTNDPTPQLSVSITDDRGELDWTSPRIFFTDKDGKTLEVTQNSDILINFVDPDGRTGPLEYGYWSGSMSYEPPEAEPLAHGTYRIRFEVSDMAGNLASAEFHFNIDNVPPALPDENLLPEDMHSTDQPLVTISGKTDPYATVIIRGINVTADDKGEFVVDLVLEPGVNDIQIMVVDWFDQDIAGNLIPGNSQIATRRIIYDTVPPLIKEVTNSTGTPTTEGVVRVSGKVEDRIGIPTLSYPWLPTDVTVTLNGKAADVFNDGSFSELIELVEGVNTIRIDARDRANNTYSHVLTITRDLTKPTVTIDPIPSEITTDEVTVSGTVEAGSTVLINGKYVPSPGGAFSVVIKLKEGLNAIKIEVFDGAGNLNDALRYATYSQPEPPSYIFIALLALALVVVLFLGLAVGNTMAARKKPEDIRYIEEEGVEESEKVEGDEPKEETVKDEKKEGPGEEPAKEGESEKE